MIFSPSSASPTIKARSRSGGISNTSTSLSAVTSTRAGLPDSWANSPMKAPGWWVTITELCPCASRWLTVTEPERIPANPGPGSPVRAIISPAA